MGEAILSAREYAFVGFRKKLSRNFLFPLLPRNGQIGFDKT